MKENNRAFPDAYPDDLYSRIIEDGADKNTFVDVYRVSDCSIINRDAFLSSAIEMAVRKGVVNRDAYFAELDKADGIDMFSTSFFEKQKDAKRILGLKKKYNDSPILMRGNIVPELGLSIRTRDSKTRDISKRSKNSHIDWWLYKDSDPSYLFNKEEL